MATFIQEPNLSKVAYCGFRIDAGTRDEAENEQGMAHFVEHLIFKGTEKRKAWVYPQPDGECGGDLNAYTNKEETVVYAAFLKEHLERALELLGGYCISFNLPQHEIKKKRRSLLMKSSRMRIPPSELIFDDFEDMIFRNHPLEETFLVNRNFCGVFARRMFYRLPAGFTNREIWCFCSGTI